MQIAPFSSLQQPLPQPTIAYIPFNMNVADWLDWWCGCFPLSLFLSWTSWEKSDWSVRSLAARAVQNSRRINTIPTENGVSPLSSFTILSLAVFFDLLDGGSSSFGFISSLFLYVCVCVGESRLITRSIGLCHWST
jgi:hypothetical protein